MIWQNISILHVVSIRNHFNLTVSSISSNHVIFIFISPARPKILQKNLVNQFIKKMLAYIKGHLNLDKQRETVYV